MKRNKPLILSLILILSIASGVFVGALKATVDNFMPITLIILFSILYGILLYYLLSKIFQLDKKIWNKKLIFVFASFSILFIIATYYTVDYNFTVKEVREYFDSKGWEFGSFTFIDYFHLKLLSSHSVGPVFLPPTVPVEGYKVFLLEFIKFAIIGATCIYRLNKHRDIITHKVRFRIPE